MMAPEQSLEGFSTDTLVSMIGALREEADLARDAAARAEYVLVRRMERVGARVVPHDTYDVKLEPGTAGLDVSRVLPLKELLPAEYLAKCWTPEHEEVVVVKERWSLRDLLATARALGGEVARLVAEATLRGPARLSVKAKALPVLQRSEGA